MNFIDELSSYLVTKGLLRPERLKELQAALNKSTTFDLETLEIMSHPENVPWGQAPWEIPPYDETKYPDVKTWIATWKLKAEPQEHLHERGGGPRWNAAHRKAIKAPELNDLLPDIILKDKLLARLFPALATGSWNASPTWKEWCDAIELLYPLDSTALDAKLQGILSSNIPRLKACVFDFILFYERTGLLLPDVLDGYSGASVSPFRTLMADEQDTEFTFNRFNWLFVNKNLLLAYHASLVNNRLRPLFKAYLKSTYPTAEGKSLPDVRSIISSDEELCRLFVRVHPKEADIIWQKWSRVFGSSFEHVKEACIFFEEADKDPTLRMRGYFGDETAEPEHNDNSLCNSQYKNVLNPNLCDFCHQTILYALSNHPEYIPRLMACGADPKHRDMHSFSPIEWYLRLLDRLKKPIVFKAPITELGNTVTWLQAQSYLKMSDWHLISNIGDIVNLFFSLEATPYHMTYMNKVEWKLIHLAAHKGSLNLAYYIFGHTPPQTIEAFLTMANETPLHLMAFKNSTESIEFYCLLRAICGKEIFKKLITLQNIYGYTILHYICRKGFSINDTSDSDDSKLVYLLIQDGAIVNTQYDTPLHIALDTLIKRRSRQNMFNTNAIIKKIIFLLEGGARVDIKNAIGETPLKIAANAIGPKIVNLLLHPNDKNARQQAFIYAKSL